MVVRVKSARSQATAREEYTHSDGLTTARVGRSVRQELGLLSVIAGDLDAHCANVGVISQHGHTGDHAKAGRERLDVVALSEVVDSVPVEDGRESVVLVLVVQSPAGQ